MATVSSGTTMELPDRDEIYRADLGWGTFEDDQPRRRGKEIVPASGLQNSSEPAQKPSLLRREYSNSSTPRQEGVSKRWMTRERQRAPNRSPSPRTGEAQELSWKDVRTVWDRDTTHDAMIHFDLDIEEDIETYVEEFCRLKRLGNFAAAENLFKETLEGHLHHPIVYLEWVELFLTKGEFQEVLRMSERLSIFDQQLAGEVLGDVTKEYTDSLFLMSTLAEVQSTGHRKRLINVMKDPETYLASRLRNLDFIGKDNSISSTTVRMISHYLQIVGRLGRLSNEIAVHPFLEVTSNISRLYTLMHELGRIWDARDIICASISTYGPRMGWKKLFAGADLYTTNLDDFISQWSLGQYDESTALAMLDILSTLAHHLLAKVRLGEINNSSSRTEQDLLVATTKVCLEHTRNIASSIRTYNQENIKSRPYIRWVMVQECFNCLELTAIDVDGQRKSLRDFLKESPGISIFLDPSPLPLYIPRGTERSVPIVFELSASSKELLEVVLNASRDLGDFQMQVTVLRELLPSSQEPAEVFRQLEQLQSNVQHDSLGSLETCLSMYPFIKDEESLYKIKNDLAKFNSFEVIESVKLDNVLGWIQVAVQASINEFLGDSTIAHHGRQIVKSLASSMPKKLRDLSSDLDFYDNNGKASDLGTLGDFGRDHINGPDREHSERVVEKRELINVSPSARQFKECLDRRKTPRGLETNFPPPPPPLRSFSRQHLNHGTSGEAPKDVGPRAEELQMALIRHNLGAPASSLAGIPDPARINVQDLERSCQVPTETVGPATTSKPKEVSYEGGKWLKENVEQDTSPDNLAISGARSPPSNSSVLHRSTSPD